MSKKTKITLLLTSIALALGISAQFYTNHKIDQNLQHFPYHIKDRFTINVVEKNRNFFGRELVITLEDAQQKKTNIITTNLRALPFAITAESKIPQQLVHELNKKLNITIDKNIINSQFSVVGDYLQSQILTDFRDLTNKPQQLEININYASKTKSMEITSNLSAFNYDAKNKVEGLKGQFVLTPIDEHQYDVTSIELNLKNADIFLLNGENTHIKLENAEYDFEKNLSDTHFDTEARFNSKKVIFSNKYKKSPQENIVINQFDATLQQSAVPNHVNFYQEVEKFIHNTPSLSDALTTVAGLLTNNEGVKSKIKLQEFIIPEKDKPFINLKDISFSLNSDHKDKKDAEIALEWGLGQAKIYLSDAIESDFITLNELNSKYSIAQMDLEKRLAFVPFYAKLSNTKHDYPAKDDEVFKQALNQLADGFKEKNQNQFKLKALNYGNIININGLEIDYKDEPSGDNQYQATLNASLSKVSHKEENLEVKQLKLALPMTFDHIKSVFLPYSCVSSEHYKALCKQNLSLDTNVELLTTLWKNIGVKINEGTLDLQLDTNPSSQANAVSATLNLDLDTQKMTSYLFSPEMLNEVTLDSKISITKGLFSPNEQATAARKKGAIWAMINQFVISPNEEIPPFLKEEGNNYVSEIQSKASKMFINGKTMAEIEEILSPKEEVMPENTSDTAPETILEAPNLDATKEANKSDEDKQKDLQIEKPAQ